MTALRRLVMTLSQQGSARAPQKRDLEEKPWRYVVGLLVASDGPTLHRRATGDELQRRSSSGSDGTRPRGGDRRGDLRGKMRKLTRSAEEGLDGSGKH